jgi:hypothetical protein
MKSSKRLAEIITKKCFPTLIQAFNWKVDCKEMVEIQCMYSAVARDIVNLLKDNPDKKITLFDIGCGKRPTLGTYFRLMFKSLEKVICIDPQLDDSLAKNIRGIQLIPDGLLESFKHIDFEEFDIAIICCNHSHVNEDMIRKLLLKLNKWYYATVPCCVDNMLSNYRGNVIKDTHNWSDKNICYKFNNFS